MPVVSFSVTDSELVNLQESAKRLELTLGEYIRSIVLPDSSSDPSINSLLEKVLLGLTSLKVGDRFSIPDFFVRTEWRQLGKGTRLNVGKEFKRLVDEAEVPGVVFVKKTSSNWAVYQKTK